MPWRRPSLRHTFASMPHHNAPLKRPARPLLLPSVYYAPWSGRHRGVLGIEDVTAYFHFGLAASLADNPWREKGIPTAIRFKRGKSTRIPHIMGIAPLPDAFDSVSAIQRTATGIRLQAASGAHIDHAVDTTFIQ